MIEEEAVGENQGTWRVDAHIADHFVQISFLIKKRLAAYQFAEHKCSRVLSCPNFFFLHCGNLQLANCRSVPLYWPHPYVAFTFL
jgi:hypothetical protein